MSKNDEKKVKTSNATQQPGYFRMKEIKGRYQRLYDPRQDETAKQEITQNLSAQEIEDLISQNSNEPRQLMNAIYLAQAKTDDIEVLKMLLKKLANPELPKRYSVTISGLQSTISSKIARIQQQMAIERIKNEVPDNILKIIRDLSRGTIDINKAQEEIDKEVRNRIKNAPKTRFALSPEQHRRQIYIQIRTVLIDRGEQFKLKNPEETVLQLRELTGSDADLNVRCVVHNLIANKQYRQAEQICDRFSMINRENEQVKSIDSLRKEIKYAEIADMVLKGINMNGTDEQESAYFELIRKGLSRAKIPLRAINLGKNKDRN